VEVVESGDVGFRAVFLCFLCHVDDLLYVQVLSNTRLYKIEGRRLGTALCALLR